MTIQLWDWLENLNWLVGADFPEADEDALWRCSGAWAGAAVELRRLLPETATAGTRVRIALGGESGLAFCQLWQVYAADDGLVEHIAAACDQLAAACDNAATEVEYAKIQYIGALVVLAAALAALTAALVAGGLSALGMPVAIAAAQFTIRMILIRLLTAMAVGLAFNVAMDAAAQSIQLLDGHRDAWDLSRTGRAAEDGAIFGAIGGGVFLAGGRFVPGLIRRPLGLLGAAGVTGAVGGVAAPLAHGEAPTGRDFLMALSSGVVGGLAPDLVHGRVRAGDLSRLGSLDPDGLGLGGFADALRLADDSGRLDPAGGGDSAGRLDPDGSPGGRSDRLVDDPAIRAGDDGPAVGPPRHREEADPPAHDPGILAGGRVDDQVRSGQPEAGGGLGVSDRIGARAGDALPDAPSDAATRPAPGGPAGTPSHGAAGPLVTATPATVVGVPTIAAPGGAGVPATASPVGAANASALTGPPAQAIRTVDPTMDPATSVISPPMVGAPALDAASPGTAASGAPDLPPSTSDDAGWRARGGQPFDFPSWRDSDGEFSLTGEQNRAAKLLLDRARDAEPPLTDLVRDLARAVGGELLGEQDRLKAPDTLKAKLARLLDSRSLPDSLARMKDTLRYTIGLPEETYVDGTAAAIDSLLEQGLRPVSQLQRWNAPSGYVGLNTSWSDPVSGHVFEIQFHTEASFIAKSDSHPLFEQIRQLSPDHPDLSALRADHDAYFADVVTPPGAAELGIAETVPRHDPTPDVPLDPRARSADDLLAQLLADPRRPATDTEALDIVRRTAFETPAGLGFYEAGDDVRDFAHAVHPTDGYVTVDVHGSPRGFQVGDLLISPEQFAAALGDLREAGVLELPEGVGIKLLSCDTGAGGERSPAALIARELGIEVIAPDQPVWTTMAGDEVLASPILVHGNLLPADPPDGAWHVFGPSGVEHPAIPDPDERAGPGGPTSRGTAAMPRAPGDKRP